MDVNQSREHAGLCVPNCPCLRLQATSLKSSCLLGSGVQNDTMIRHLTKGAPQQAHCPSGSAHSHDNTINCTP